MKFLLFILFLMLEVNATFQYVPKIYDFFEDNTDADVYCLAGGRGKGATWGIGNEIISRAISETHFILCTREIKSTVDHSSRRTIERLIKRAGLRKYFIFQDKKTICKLTNTVFIYTGLSKITEDNVQGMEGITIAWLGEAHTMALSTWQKFEPTMRENNAVVFIDYNTQYSTTPIHALLTENPQSWPFKGKKDIPELAYLFMTYEDNIFCPERTLKTIERNRKQYSKADFEWMWLGKLKDSSDKFVTDELKLQAAIDRVVECDMLSPLIVGCDIAHLGGDEIVFYKRREYKFLDEGRKMTMKKHWQVCDELEAYISYEKNSILVIDNGHVGAAVADEMEKRGYYVERVNFGGKPHVDPAHNKDCATDMAFNFNDMLPKLQLPKDSILKNQISQRKWFFRNNTVIRKIESKDEFKEHAVHLEGHKSPDRGDAAWLCCYNKRKDPPLPGGINSALRAWK